MSELLSLSGIAVALAVGAASPGPSFLMVARTAVSNGRQSGIAAAVGMGIGALVFAITALFGLTAMLLAVPWLYASFKIIGGAYLLYLAIQIWRGAKRPLQQTSVEPQTLKSDSRKQFMQGLATQISNPKTAIVYGSVFAAFMPSAPSLQFNVLALATVFFVETGWYAIVAVLLSSPQTRHAYLQHKKWLDRIAGTILGTLGLKLAVSTTTQ